MVSGAFLVLVVVLQRLVNYRQLGGRAQTVIRQGPTVGP